MMINLYHKNGETRRPTTINNGWLYLAILQTCPFWDGENVTLSKVIGDLQLRDHVRSWLESDGRVFLREFPFWVINHHDSSIFFFKPGYF